MEHNILITGSTGFVGKNFLAHVKNKPGYNLYPLNLRGGNIGAIGPNITQIIHLAGKAHDLKKTSDDAEYFAVNTDLTTKLFDEFLKSNAHDFIFFSTVKAAKDVVDGILTENVNPDPKTAYGLSKQKAEEYILKQALPAGKRVFILRPCMMHGPGNKGNLNLLYKVVQKGIPYPLAAFENKRSFLSIDNLLFIVERILDGPAIKGGVYNLADDDSLSTNELIKVIATAAGTKPRLWAMPAGFIKGLAVLGDKLHLPLNSERLQKLTKSYQVSNQKIKDALHISSLPVSAGEGLFNTIKSFKNTA